MPIRPVLDQLRAALPDLSRRIIEDFARLFSPGSELVYAGGAGVKCPYADADVLATLSAHSTSYRKMPDVVLYDAQRNGLFLIESGTAQGALCAARRRELATLFAQSGAALVYVTAFPNRHVMGQYLTSIPWEMTVWIADAPTHLIHFNGGRYLGPYREPTQAVVLTEAERVQPEGEQRPLL